MRREVKDNMQRKEGHMTKKNDDRRYPESPRPRRTNPEARGHGGWDAIDIMTVDQWARMPMGLQTVVFIPNSL